MPRRAARLLASVEGLQRPRRVVDVLDEPVVAERHPYLEPAPHAHPTVSGRRATSWRVAHEVGGLADKGAVGCTTETGGLIATSGATPRSSTHNPPRRAITAAHPEHMVR